MISTSTRKSLCPIWGKLKPSILPATPKRHLQHDRTPSSCAVVDVLLGRMLACVCSRFGSGVFGAYAVLASQLPAGACLSLGLVLVLVLSLVLTAMFQKEHTGNTLQRNTGALLAGVSPLERLCFTAETRLQHAAPVGNRSERLCDLVVASSCRAACQLSHVVAIASAPPVSNWQ